MEKIITGDGSETFQNDEFGEKYHSMTGAVEEARKKYIEPCRIEELAKNKSMNILDVGFGLGYNVAEAINATKEENQQCGITIISLEKDPKVFELIRSVGREDYGYRMIKKAAESFSGGDVLVEQDNIRLQILFGNAEERIRDIDRLFDAVFLDPFSPKRNPELWTESFLKGINSRMSPGAILVTYSCARAVRDNLKASGFLVEDGPHVGRRGPSTIAIKQKAN